MWAALAIALLPVALGVGLGLAPAFQLRLGGPARTFALAAAATVVFAQLLPTSAAALGLPAFGIFAAGLFGPGLVEWVARRLHRGSGMAGWLAVGAVALHQLVDGLEIGATWGRTAGRGIALSIGAHAVPLVAVVVQRHGRARPGRVAGIAALLLAATAAGVAGGQVGAADLHAVHGWLPALVGGLLLHVMAHSLDARPPERAVERALEVGAMAGGVALPLLLLAPEAGAPDTVARVLAALGPVTLAVAPLLLLGLAASALLRPGRLAGRAAAAGPVAVGAFAFAAPALGPEALVLSIGLLGGAVAAARVALAALGAAGAGWVLGRLAGARTAGIARPAGPPRSRWQVLEGRVLALGPWMAVSLMLTASVEAFVPALSLERAARGGLDAVGAAALALPTTYSATAAMPIAGVAWAGGASAFAVLLALVWGPGLGAPELARLAGRVGGRAAALAGLTFFGSTLVGAALVAQLLDGTPPPETVWPAGVAAGSALALGLLVSRSLWRAGPRAWAAQLLRPAGSPSGLAPTGRAAPQR